MIRIKLPFKCLLPLVAKPELLKAFCIYGKLKILAGKKGFIFDFKKEKQTLASKLGISTNTFRKYISILNSNGLSYESNGNLRLSHQYKIYEVLGLEPNQKDNKLRTKQLRLSFEELTPLNIQFHAFKHKREHIRFKQLQSIQKTLIQSVGTIHCERINKKLIKNTRSSSVKIYENLCGNLSYNYGSERKYGYLDDNISNLSTAKLLGRRTRMTGSRFISKLRDKNLVSVQERSIHVGKLGDSKISVMREEIGQALFLSGDSVRMRLTNRVTII